MEKTPQTPKPEQLTISFTDKRRDRTYRVFTRDYLERIRPEKLARAKAAIEDHFNRQNTLNVKS